MLIFIPAAAGKAASATPRTAMQSTINPIRNFMAAPPEFEWAACQWTGRRGRPRMLDGQNRVPQTYPRRTPLSSRAYDLAGACAGVGTSPAPAPSRQILFRFDSRDDLWYPFPGLPSA